MFLIRSTCENKVATNRVSPFKEWCVYACMVVLYYTVLYLAICTVFFVHMWFQWKYNGLVIRDEGGVDAPVGTNMKNKYLPVLRVRL